MFIDSFKKKYFSYRRLISLLLITGLLSPNAVRAMDNPLNQKKKDFHYIEDDEVETSVTIEGDEWTLVPDSDNLLTCITNTNKKLPVFTKDTWERINKPLQSSKGIFSSWSNEEDN
jgi:hypothetical protein